MAFLTGVLVYGDEFPLPRTLDDFDEVVAYMQAFDPIENFTRFAGTDNFSAAYDAMVGSEEWEGLSDALDNLSNNEMVFASFQTVLRNIALLSVSAHPEAIIDGLEAWVALAGRGLRQHDAFPTFGVRLVTDGRDRARPRRRRFPRRNPVGIRAVAQHHRGVAMASTNGHLIPSSAPALTTSMASTSTC